MPTNKHGGGAGNAPAVRDSCRGTSQILLRSESASARTDFGWAAANARLHARGRVGGILPSSARASAKADKTRALRIQRPQRAEQIDTARRRSEGTGERRLCSWQEWNHT